MTAILLHAPFAGWSAPLDEVPDAVFADGMMGEGLAIDPIEGLVRAPCEAEVIAVPASRHAVTLRLANGAELLIHVGLETVALAGKGFTAHVAAGQRVSRGDPLIGFDLDEVARQAKSLISPIVVTGAGYRFAPLAIGRAVAAGERLAEVTGEGEAATVEGAGAICTIGAVVGARHGIHARPAARIAAAAKAFSASIEAGANGRTANCRSVVALMAMDLAQDDKVTVIARGTDAAAAAAAVAASIAEIGEEPGETPPPAPVTPAEREAAGRQSGVCAAPGLAVGPAARFGFEPVEVSQDGRGVAEEGKALAGARAAVAARLASRAAGGAGIVEAHLGLLDDPELIAAATAEIAAGRSAGFAWRTATAAVAAKLRATGNALLIERIDDLMDVERQLLGRLAGESEPGPRRIVDGAILVADNLLPSHMMMLDLERIGGICTARGGPTSHVAILAAAAGVPMLAAAGDGVLALADGTELILDATGGWIATAPDEAALAAARDRLDRRRQAGAAAAKAAAAPCRMADGTRIEIFANLASEEEARRAVAAGAEGCGLLRTEFLFHGRTSPPAEEEQRAAYAGISRALEGRPLIVRTLDAGGDKPLPWLALPPEDNPALGMRGVRLSLARPDLLAAQLRAILRTASDGDIRIMVPMIVDVLEYRAVREALAGAAAALGAASVPLGVMIETPAAALLADSLAAEADFLSVGSNDLAQYALAADRGNPATAERIDALHPAVLRLIASAASAARRHGKWLGICGGVASDPLASAILIGLGAGELSAAPAAIPALKAVVRRLDMARCAALAARALEAGTGQEVRALAAEALAPDLRGAE